MASVTLLQSNHALTTTTAPAVVCHDRFGYLTFDDFARRSCTLCYVYLFPSPWPTYVALRPEQIYLIPLIGLIVSQSTEGGNESAIYGDDPEEEVYL